MHVGSVYGSMDPMKTFLTRFTEKKEIKQLRTSAQNGAIQTAYERRAKEIESLRQYDRGEKHIIAPDLRTLVRDVSEARR